LNVIQVAYQRILQLTYVDDLLAALKTIFIKLFEPFLATFVASLHALSSGKVVSTTGEPATQWNFAKAFEGWDKVFDKLLKGLEDKAAQVGTHAGQRQGTHPYRMTGQKVSSPYYSSSSRRGLDTSFR
jgi:hypothetical protein